ncbi:hypothetical protein P7K49_035230 [Saguinus oedipus]|uniref:Uncharacterized protein n=1 Tax=Saguinus oedipus TaxID=9490 RepID=A0ABQ9TM18_SAGOE|nr:hypothetical protein P7K49_035230 [Saguinus oedipus]
METGRRSAVRGRFPRDAGARCRFRLVHCGAHGTRLPHLPPASSPTAAAGFVEGAAGLAGTAESRYNNDSGSVCFAFLTHFPALARARRWRTRTTHALRALQAALQSRLSPELRGELEALRRPTAASLV